MEDRCFNIAETIFLHRLLPVPAICMYGFNPIGLWSILVSERQSKVFYKKKTFNSILPQLYCTLGLPTLSENFMSCGNAFSLVLINPIFKFFKSKLFVVMT